MDTLQTTVAAGTYDWPGNPKRFVVPEPTLECPQCHHQIKLTESLAAPLLAAARRDFARRLEEKDLEVLAKETTLRQREQALLAERQALDDQVAQKLQAERGKIAAEEAGKARQALAMDLAQKNKDLADLQEVLQAREFKLAEAQKAQAELIRKQRELADARREMDLTIERRVQESLARTRDQARKEAEEGLKLKVLEKEQTITAMQTQIEELKRRAEQGSQQLQGEVQELDLEAALRRRFPYDRIEPVPKGEYGGDVLHHVHSPAGQACGLILWECKRTRNWSDTWLPKLRDDQRAAKADAAIIVTQVLPRNVTSFDLVDGVWVTSSQSALPVALVLRQSLLELATARQAGQGQQTKMELVYQYLTGPRFRHRVEAIVEKFTAMQADLDKERKAMTRLWCKRQEQIHGVLEATAGMYGDLQGIAGQHLPELQGLEPPMLSSDTPGTPAPGSAPAPGPGSSPGSDPGSPGIAPANPRNEMPVRTQW